jgi:transketolase
MLNSGMKRMMRYGYGEELVSLGSSLADLVVLESDLGRSTKSDLFAEVYPDRYFNLGIAEANMVGVAAGLARVGFIPFATTYAIFVGRAFDQIRQAVCYSESNVKIVGSHTGLAAGYDGGSHQSLEDIALMRTLPEMVILSPADYLQTRQAVRAAAQHFGPVYIRFSKEPVIDITVEESEFRIGLADTLREGNDLCLMACGALVAEALAAARIFEARGIHCRVVNHATIKPLDVDSVRRADAECERLVAIEEHSRIGGLYSAICEGLEGSARAPIISVSMFDRFGESGGWRQLLHHFQLDADGIVATVSEALQRG